MVLVTGGTGLVGSHLLYELVKSGEEVRAIKRNKANCEQVKEMFTLYTDKPEILFSRIKWIEADITDYHSVLEAMEGISEVYHCAALVSFYPHDRDSMIRVNAEGTANIVNAALEKKVRKLCHVSSIAAIGMGENDEIINEATLWKTSKKNTNYGISKYNSENEVWRGINEGLDSVIVNPSIIIGPYYRNSGITELLNRIYHGLIFYPVGVNGFVDVRDVSTAMIKLMKSEVKNERFIISSENVTYYKLCELCAKHLKARKPMIPAYKYLAELYWLFVLFASKVKDKKPFVTKETVVTACDKNYYSNKKIREMTGIVFIPVEETISKFANLYLEHLNQGL